MANIKCQECGCMCKQCKNDQVHNDVHLHVEIENLRQRLVEKDNHIVTMETQFLNEANKFPNGELASLREEIITWQDKYTRLNEAHKRVQKVNQNLEDKLLKIVDKCETEKGAFTKDIATLSHRLAEANYTIHRLTQDNEKYRNDVNLAIQLLQCKPSNYIGQKFESLSPEVQAKVRTYISQKSRVNEEPSSETRSITVPISTFPPTAMVYNVAKPMIDKQDVSSDDESKPPVEVVSANIMAKVLEDRGKERIFARHCISCTCHRSVLKIDSETQTTTDLKGILTMNNSNKFDRIDMIKKNTMQNNELRRSDSDKRTQVTGNFLITQNVETDLLTKDFKTNNTPKIAISSNSTGKNALNLKNVNKQNNGGNNNTETDTGPEETNDNERERLNLDNQAKINMINERVWKNSWMNSTGNLSRRDESQTQLDVINERVWRNSTSSGIGNKPSEKPAGRWAVVEVRSASEESASPQSDRIEDKHEPTTSPSPSADSASTALSSLDPSSMSSDARPPRRQFHRSSGTDERVSGYQTVLYTSGSSRPSTALVHVVKANARSTSGSDEGAEGQQLARVAQWVSDSLTHETKLCDINERRSNVGAAATTGDTVIDFNLNSDSTTQLLLHNPSEESRKINAWS